MNDTVVFVCTRNAIRSPMAEGLLKHLAGDRLHILSAGLEPEEMVHPLAVKVMQEEGIDISRHTPQGLDNVSLPTGGQLIYLNNPQVIPDAIQRFVDSHQASLTCWPIDNPDAIQGSQTMQMMQYRTIRDQLQKCITDSF